LIATFSGCGRSASDCEVRNGADANRLKPTMITCNVAFIHSNNLKTPVLYIISKDVLATANAYER